MLSMLAIVVRIAPFATPGPLNNPGLSPLLGASFSIAEAGIDLSRTASNPVNSVYSGQCNVSFSEFVPVPRVDPEFVIDFLCWMLFLFRQLPLFLTLYPALLQIYMYLWDLLLVECLLCPCLPGSPQMTLTS